MATKFFVNPFAAGGDKTPVPDTIQVGGSVSYAEGWGFDYQRDLATDPAALPIPRAQMNQLLFDMTQAIRQYQSIGVPEFVTTAQNLGVAFPYNKYALAYYDDGVNGLRIYQSLVGSNTTLPTDATKWKLLDGGADALIFYDATLEATVNDGDAVYYDGVNSRFAKAIADGTVAQKVVGIADKTNKRVYISGLVPILSGLTSGNTYYLSSTTAGMVTTSRPVYNAIQIGIANSTTSLFFNPIALLPSSFVGANVYLNNIQSISGSNVPNKVLFDTVDYNTGAFWDSLNNRYIIQIDGYYRVTGRLFFPIAGLSVYIEVYKNGVSYARLSEHACNGLNTLPFGSITALLTAGDIIELYAYSTAAGATNVGGSGLPFSGFEIEYKGQ